MITDLEAVPKALPDYSWTLKISEISKLEVVASKIEQVVAALSRDDLVTDRSELDDKVSLVPDDISDSASVESIGSISDIIEEMKVCTECLVDLLPSLENPAKDMEAVERNRTMGEVPIRSQPWWLFFLRAKDKFPSADNDLVVRIGEATWRRWEKIRLNRATKAAAWGNEPENYK